MLVANKTLETSVPFKFGSTMIDVPVRANYSFSQILPATSVDPESGGVELQSVYVNIGGTWQAVDWDDEPDWILGLIREAYNECGIGE